MYTHTWLLTGMMRNNLFVAGSLHQLIAVVDVVLCRKHHAAALHQSLKHSQVIPDAVAACCNLSMRQSVLLVFSCQGCKVAVDTSCGRIQLQATLQQRCRRSGGVSRSSSTAVANVALLSWQPWSTEFAPEILQPPEPCQPLLCSGYPRQSAIPTE